MENDFYNSKEINNWNNAPLYSKIKILKLLVFADEYETIALFGTSEMLEDLYLDDETRKSARVTALERLTATLIQLIGNSYFAMRSQGDKKILDDFSADLEKIRDYLPKVFTRGKDRNLNTVVDIDELKFKKVIKVLKLIKDKINEPLNRADLIFKGSENYDYKTMKQMVKDKMIFGG